MLLGTKGGRVISLVHFLFVDISGAANWLFGGLAGSDQPLDGGREGRKQSLKWCSPESL